jgi:hypothetical protein
MSSQVNIMSHRSSAAKSVTKAREWRARARRRTGRLRALGLPLGGGGCGFDKLVLPLLGSLARLGARLAARVVRRTARVIYYNIYYFIFTPFVFFS